MKRIISITLAIILCLGMLPFGVAASEEADLTEEAIEEPVEELPDAPEEETAEGNLEELPTESAGEPEEVPEPAMDGLPTLNARRSGDTISWDAVTNAVDYSIFFATDSTTLPDGSFFSVTGTSFNVKTWLTNKKAPSGTYTFIIRARNSGNETIAEQYVYDYSFTSSYPVLPTPNAWWNGRTVCWDQLDYDQYNSLDPNAFSDIRIRIYIYEDGKYLTSRTTETVGGGLFKSPWDVSSVVIHPDRSYYFTMQYYLYRKNGQTSFSSSGFIPIYDSKTYTGPTVTGQLLMDGYNSKTQTVVTVDPNGGTGSASTYYQTIGSTFQVPNTCTFAPPSGMEFAGWTVNGVQTRQGASFTVTGPTTVAPVWKNAIGPDISLQLTAPKAGDPVSAPDGRISLGTSFTIYEQGWGTGYSLSHTSDATFQNGKTYVYHAVLKPNNGYVFQGYDDISELTVYVNASKASYVSRITDGPLTHVSVSDASGWLIVYANITPKGSTFGNVIRLEDVPVPRVGEPVTVGGTPSVGSLRVTSQSISYYNGSKLVDTAGKYQAGKKYYYSCTVAPPEGSIFDVADDGYTYKNNVYLNNTRLDAVDGVTVFLTLLSAAGGGEPELIGYTAGKESMTLYCSFTPASGKSGVLGDADGSGARTKYDAALILRHVVGNGTIRQENLNWANGNGDTVLNAADAAWVLKAAG